MFQCEFNQHRHASEHDEIEIVEGVRQTENDCNTSLALIFCEERNEQRAIVTHDLAAEQASLDRGTG